MLLQYASREIICTFYKGFAKVECSTVDISTRVCIVYIISSCEDLFDQSSETGFQHFYLKLDFFQPISGDAFSRLSSYTKGV
jgi:hypothetical protein